MMAPETGAADHPGAQNPNRESRELVSSDLTDMDSRPSARPVWEHLTGDETHASALVSALGIDPVIAHLLVLRGIAAPTRRSGSSIRRSTTCTTPSSSRIFRWQSTGCSAPLTARNGSPCTATTMSTG